MHINFSKKFIHFYYQLLEFSELSLSSELSSRFSDSESLSELLLLDFFGLINFFDSFCARLSLIPKILKAISSKTLIVSAPHGRINKQVEIDTMRPKFPFCTQQKSVKSMQKNQRMIKDK